MKFAKGLVCASAMAASALFGDCYNICDRFVYPAMYSGTLVAKGFYRRPFDLRKEYRVNPEGFLEVYFGDVDMYPVSDSLRVNERGIGERIKDEAKDLVKRGGRGAGDLLDSIKDLGYDFYEGVVNHE